MAEKNTKLNILEHAARIVHKKGFNNTGIKEILDTAGVPKGSFYHYFKSKEDFGLSLLDYYSGFFISKAEESFNADGPPLLRLKKLFDDFLGFFENNGCELGCPIGNLSQEMGDLNTAFRLKLESIFKMMQSQVIRFLDEAKHRDELPKNTNTSDMADFIINSWEGAILRMKALKSTEPLLLFDKMLFGKMLKSTSKKREPESGLLF